MSAHPGAKKKSGLFGYPDGAQDFAAFRYFRAGAHDHLQVLARLVVRIVRIIAEGRTIAIIS